MNAVQLEGYIATSPIPSSKEDRMNLLELYRDRIKTLERQVSTKDSFSPTVAMQHSAIVIICRLSSLVVCLSVTRVYCDKTAEVRIIQFSQKCSPMP